MPHSSLLPTLGIALLLAGCTGLPKGTEPVTDFELDRYLGQWYEIARLDHSFERGMECVTADYSLRDDGGVRVLNRGVRLDDGEIELAEGRAYFIGDEDVGRLKVSFFGPFYGGYNVLALDDDYRWSLVAGPDRDYLWILARTPSLDEATRQALVAEARGLDFPVEELIWVEQGQVCDTWRKEA
ncbi:lipocalin family protein [Halomonas sp. KAO]|uniref:lipocalin family protein n=1 Tax=unclassified Halomonas TaxID=2609666 RepID=UPI00189E7EBA|nr:MULTISPECIES: lipocalin family protein [unclassified Halomonas]MBF7055054.1 lipocalin family protein [Halomonas sp. KAO]MDT0501378.1 lipocalin family protein [Halomonas sp. PAR7]MDT0512948.1 lipocalin family protein [Halomonas sp. LES1]MDT0591227.1 lipocalin family protein [Halomonas sp. PAR8]